MTPPLSDAVEQTLKREAYTLFRHNSPVCYLCVEPDSLCLACLKSIEQIENGLRAAFHLGAESRQEEVERLTTAQDEAWENWNSVKAWKARADAAESSLATATARITELEQRIEGAKCRLEGELQTPDDIWADHIREAVRWLSGEADAAAAERASRASARPEEEREEKC